MDLMSGAEFLLWAVLGFLFWKRKLNRRFPAMALSCPACGLLARFVLLFYLQTQPWGTGFLAVYFFSFYGVYVASAVLLFFVPWKSSAPRSPAFSGLMKLGAVVFRWAVLASPLVTFSHDLLLAPRRSRHSLILLSG